MRTPRLHPNRITPHVAWQYMNRIRVTRLARGLSVRQAAESIGWHRANWGNVETGVVASPSVDTVHAMAAAVGLSLDLVPEDTPPPEYLPPLDAEQVRALALLAVWYGEQNTGELPPALASAIEIMRDYADRPPRKLAFPGPPRHDRTSRNVAGAWMKAG